MPLLLRVINKRRWDLSQRPPWLHADAVPADTLADLKTDDNELSLWEIDDERSNLNAVIAAMAANRGSIDKFDFALFDRARLTSGAADVRIEKRLGVSKDAAANDAWHWDLIELTAVKIAAVAKVVYDPSTEFGRRVDAQVIELIADAVRSNRFGLEAVTDSIRKKVESFEEARRKKSAGQGSSAASTD
jgi:hypothetical protein